MRLLLRYAVVIAALIMAPLLLTACDEPGEEPSPTPTATVEPSPTALPPSPTPSPAVAPSPQEPVQPAVTPALSPDEAIQSICLTVEQSYPEIEEEFSLPIAETVRRILAGLGLNVVAEGTPCDATLTVALTGEPLGASYVSQEGAHFCYTGATYDGQMALAMPRRAPATLRITSEGGPYTGPSPILRCPSETEAPFPSVWPEAVLDGLADLWGIELLVQALDDEDSWVGVGAVRVLGEMGQEAIPALIQALEGNNEELVRQAAAQALGEMGSEEGVVPALIDALADEHWWVRSDAAEALGEIGPEEGVVPALVDALADEQWSVRKAAAEALGEIGPEQGIVRALIQALEDEDQSVGAAAAEALGKIGPEAVEAVPALIEALEDATMLGMLEETAEALEAITGQDFGRDVDRWRQWWEEQQ